ncbi:SigE family RNA polymerase sigma factor [Catenulispora rubra]|uniref:SigE family RNA polymerase sigma factor n=1 Tax=Catenulispora rubra TaxID=280293 RepID=UPI0018920591|nr:SigE family RNA polymerase sigma factor [Catenulispora rubra]
MKNAEAAEFHEFVTARWSRLVRTAYLLTGHRHDAEDLAQNTLVQVYQGWGRVRMSESPDAYVHKIMVRCNGHRFRKRRVAERLGDPPEGGMSDATDQVAQRHALVAALQDLPRKQRAIVVLRFWSDLTERETAGVLGCSVGTVKSQTHRALARLRQHPALGSTVHEELMMGARGL